MNQNIRKLLDAIALLQDVHGCELERASLSHKVQAMYQQGKEGLEGIAFIDACNDEELIAAISQGAPRTHLYPHICLETFNYLRRTRPRCIAEGDRLRRCR